MFCINCGARAMEGDVFCANCGQRLVLVAENTAQPAAVSASSPSPSGGVSLELTNVGYNKVRVIKVLRDLFGIGLAEAKGITDVAPVVFINDISPEEADNIKRALEAEGAVVTLK